MPQISLAKVIPLDRIGDEPVGGKAAQLAQLIRLGLRVPDGFVVVDAAPGNLPAELDDYGSRLGGSVAVRSSALGEDSAEASFAGQFETVLSVQGASAIHQAVERGLTSAAGARAGLPGRDAPTGRRAHGGSCCHSYAPDRQVRLP